MAKWNDTLLEEGIWSTFNSGFSNIFIDKIGYTGSKEFELGLQFSYFDVNQQSVEKEVYVFKTMLMLKFFSKSA